jgi:hypothetical protein
MSGRSKVLARGVAVLGLFSISLGVALCCFFAPRIQVKPLSYSRFYNGFCLSVRIMNGSPEPLKFSREHSCTVFRRERGEWVSLSPGNHVPGKELSLKPRETFDLGLVIPPDCTKGWLAFNELKRSPSKWRLLRAIQSAIDDRFPYMRYRAWHTFDLGRLLGPTEKHAHNTAK